MEGKTTQNPVGKGEKKPPQVLRIDSRRSGSDPAPKGLRGAVLLGSPTGDP
jgi:hypothetical protein